MTRGIKRHRRRGSKSNSIDVSGTSGQLFCLRPEPRDRRLRLLAEGKLGKNQLSGTITVTV